MSTIPTPKTSVLDAFQVELLTALEPYMETVSFSPEERIFDEGKPGEAFYIIDEGEVRLEVHTPEPDTDGVLDHQGPGTFLGEVGLLGGTVQMTSAVADTEVTARKVSAKGFRRLLDDDPQQGIAVLRSLGRDVSTKLERATHRLAEQMDIEVKDPEVEATVAAALAAQKQFESWDEERVDALLQDIAESVAARAEEIANATVDETTLGNAAHKALKIQMGSLAIFESLKGKPGIGPIGTDNERGVTEIAAPVGVVFGLVPVTNPAPTFVNKSLICLKSRNAVILSCHRMAQGVGATVGEIIQGVLEQHGAPRDLVQWVKGRTNRRKTARFMRHDDVGMILATGGPGMVKAAYSSGKPAIGVGAGNAPAWIAPDADIDRAARAVIDSKEFDYGLICGSEQHLVVDASVRDELVSKLEEHGAAVLSDEETQRFMSAVFEENGDLKMFFIGRAAEKIAEAAGIPKPGARLIVFQADASNPEGAQARERLAPVLSLYTVEGDEQAMALCKSILSYEGTGHTANIHTEDRARIDRFAAAMPASRILVNVPSAYGCSGVVTGLLPTFTLGCGTWGGNSTTNNVSYADLRNVKRLAFSTA